MTALTQALVFSAGQRTGNDDLRYLEDTSNAYNVSGQAPLTGESGSPPANLFRATFLAGTHKAVF